MNLRSKPLLIISSYLIITFTLFSCEKYQPPMETSISSLFQDGLYEDLFPGAICAGVEVRSDLFIVSVQQNEKSWSCGHLDWFLEKGGAFPKMVQFNQYVPNFDLTLSFVWDLDANRLFRLTVLNLASVRMGSKGDTLYYQDHYPNQKVRFESRFRNLYPWGNFYLYSQQGFVRAFVFNGTCIDGACDVFGILFDSKGEVYSSYRVSIDGRVPFRYEHLTAHQLELIRNGIKPSAPFEDIPPLLQKLLGEY